MTFIFHLLSGVALLVLPLWGGAILKAMSGVAIPAPVLGVVILVAGLMVYGRVPEGLRLVSGFLLRHMVLFFIPALVSLLAVSDLLADIWMRLALIIIVSTLLPLWATAWAFQKFAPAIEKSDHAPD